VVEALPQQHIRGGVISDGKVSCVQQNSTSGVFVGSHHIGNASGPDHGVVTVSVYYDKVAIAGDFQLCLVDAGADDWCLPIGILLNHMPRYQLEEVMVLVDLLRAPDDVGSKKPSTNLLLLETRLSPTVSTWLAVRVPFVVAAEHGGVCCREEKRSPRSMWRADMENTIASIWPKLTAYDADGLVQTQTLITGYRLGLLCQQHYSNARRYFQNNVRGSSHRQLGPGD
jgi:hypothetical protein